MLRCPPLLTVVVGLTLARCAAAAPIVSFTEEPDRLSVRIGDAPVAEYVFEDEQTLRPYFRHLRTRSGAAVTRTHPPVKGVDLDDHPTMHPGLWMAFGDLGGADLHARSLPRIRPESRRNLRFSWIFPPLSRRASGARYDAGCASRSRPAGMQAGRPRSPPPHPPGSAR